MKINTDSIDISEEYLFRMGNDILEILLKDRTTGRNIYWATNDYSEKGKGFSFFDEITIDNITGLFDHTIQPRIMKRKTQQQNRSKKMAEVFTPSWICNEQNNLIDSAWFERKDVFNVPFEKNGKHSWVPVKDKITCFPDGKDWITYVCAPRMEMACGEAPYLCSRFDATTGEFFEDVLMRIGLLDRKLRLVNENASEQNVDKTATWRRWALKAYQSIYGFEYQGDNLLIARESLLWTYREFYKARWGEYPKVAALKKIAEIISWNVWQMDGLTCGLPGYPTKEKLHDKIESDILPHEKLCRIMEWSRNRCISGTPIIFKELAKNKQ